MTRRRSIFLIGIACLSALGVLPAIGQVITNPDIPALLTHILPSKTPDGLDIKLVCTFYSTYTTAEARSPNRIVIDLHGVEDIAAPRLIEINTSGVVKIRAGMYLKGVARVVLDFADEIPAWRVSPVKEGLMVSIRPRPGTANPSEAKPETRLDLNLVEPAKAKEGAKEKKEASDREKPAGRKLPRGTARILSQTIESRPQPKKNFLRLIASGDYFFPRQGALRDVYRRGMNYGGEIDISVARFLELWVSGHYFGKTATDTATGGERKVSLIPIGAGIKFRFHRGVFNPYLGLGGGYFQYKDKTGAGTVKERRAGLVGQAGIFLKIARLVVVDLSAQYKYCPMKSAAGTFDVGGFHIGVGLGVEF